jgi:hypothetical protein
MDPMIIPLDAEVVSAPNAYHLGILFAYMVSPDDVELRKRAMHTAAVEHGLDLMASGHLTRSQIEKLAVGAFDATSLSDLQQLCEERVRRGYAAGMIFHQSCKALALGERAALQQEKNKIAGALFREASGTSKHTDDAVWKVFKPVAALWATFIELSDSESTTEIPCNRKDLPHWLAWFDSMRLIGERTKTHSKGQPVLPPGESFRLPDQVISLLPHGEIVIR